MSENYKPEPFEVSLSERRTPHSVVFEAMSWVMAAAAVFWAIVLLSAGADSGSWGVMVVMAFFTWLPMVACWAGLRLLDQRSRR